MDIQKEKKAIKNLKAFLMEEWELTEEQKDEFDNLVFRVLAVGKEEAEAKAVPKWIDYEKQSPPTNGRYQIFINDEQLAADWEAPYGFSDPIEGDALIQERITHWSVLNSDPEIKTQEPAND